LRGGGQNTRKGAVCEGRFALWEGGGGGGGKEGPAGRRGPRGKNQMGVFFISTRTCMLGGKGERFVEGRQLKVLRRSDWLRTCCRNKICRTQTKKKGGKEGKKIRPKGGEEWGKNSLQRLVFAKAADSRGAAIPK